MGAGIALAACASDSQGPKTSADITNPNADVPQGPLPGAPKDNEITLPAGATMPKRRLGKTGVDVSIVGLGGYHIGIPKDEQDSRRIIRYALDHGVNFLDNCWDYHKGESERRMGLALKDGYRQKAFLMTKLDGRTKQSAAEQLEQSLKRLGVDVIDLVQIHEVIRADDPARVFGPNGAIEAFVAAQKAGKLRFIGFTGHKDPALHLGMLKMAAEHGFRFDTVQMPVNVMDPHYRSFEALVLPELVREDIGVLAMKPLGSGVILQSGAATAPECLRYSMSRDSSVVITGCDSLGVLQQALKAAYTFQPMAEAETQELLARTAPAGQKGQYEQFKTTKRFDGTDKNPHWLTSAKI